MSSTERAREPSLASTIKADMQHFAALPDWLTQAAQPDRVAHLLMRSLPECATGDMTVQTCKIGGLRLNPATHTWSGTYTLTVTQPALAQRQVIPSRARCSRQDSRHHGGRTAMSPLAALAGAATCPSCA